LSPALIRKMKFFDLQDDSKSDLVVRAIHNERGYQAIRTNLANQYDVVQNEPEIEVVDVDLNGDRRLILQHRVYGGILTKEKDTVMALRHLADLWGYEVTLTEVAAQTDVVLKQHSAAPGRHAR
jgi:stage V sporulation protein R